MSPTTDIGRFAIVPEWLLDDPEVSDSAIRLYATIWAKYADRNGESTTVAKRRTLARDTHKSSVRSVDKAKAELIAAGALVLVPRYGDDGSRLADEWVLHGAQESAQGGTDSSAGDVQNPAQLEPESSNPEVSSTEETTVEQNGQQQLLDEEPSTPKRPAKPDAVVYITEVFDYWREVMGKQGTVLLNEKRRSAIGARLREGYSVDDLKLAVDGCKNTPHNMGKNDRGRAFNDVELICRNGANVERFRDTAAVPGSVKRDRHRLGQTTIDDDAVFAKGHAAIHGR